MKSLNVISTIIALSLIPWCISYAEVTSGNVRIDLQSPRGTSPFAPEIYAERRVKLMETLGPGLVVIKAASNLNDNKQDADFAYLTGIVDEADTVLVLSLDKQEKYKEYLFLSPYMPEVDVWHGERLPYGEQLNNRTGIKKIFRMPLMQSILPHLAVQAGSLHFLGPLVGPDAPVPWSLDMLRKISARVPGLGIQNHYTVLPTMRAVKEPGELELMKKAISATSAAHQNAMKQVKPGMFEYELQDIIEDTFRQHGAHKVAFSSIVGSGPNAAILHYHRNDRLINDGDIMLVDIGAEYQHYASDITRTFPANGTFTPRQREIYNIVLEAQNAAVAALKAGAMVREDIQHAAEQVFRKYDLRDNFLHGIGHFVGLRVHDAGIYSSPLPAGAVITIEPGLYLADESIGVRIEDQYLVTETGAVHLTDQLPRTVDEVESFMARQ